MTEGMPLSLLVEQLAADGPRDAAFVRAFAQWLAERAPTLRLSLVERLQLSDVVVTFKMKQSVRLIITGYPPDELPGEVTVTVDEQDFPFVRLTSSEEGAGYDFCTLDYSLTGRRVRHGASGREGRLVVAATVGTRQENRVRLDSGEVVTLSGDALELLP